MGDQPVPLEIAEMTQAKNVFEYMNNQETIGLSMLLSTITYSLVGELKIKIFDPIFEEVFPFNDFVLNIDIGERVIELGGAFYEFFRWINYATILFIIISVVGKNIPSVTTFFSMFAPFFVLMLLKRIFVHPTKKHHDNTEKDAYRSSSPRAEKETVKSETVTVAPSSETNDKLSDSKRSSKKGRGGEGTVKFWETGSSSSVFIT